MSTVVELIDGPCRGEHLELEQLPIQLHLTTRVGTITGGGTPVHDVVTYERHMAADRPGWWFAYRHVPESTPRAAAC